MSLAAPSFISASTIAKISTSLPEKGAYRWVRAVISLNLHSESGTLRPGVASCMTDSSSTEDATCLVRSLGDGEEISTAYSST